MDAEKVGSYVAGYSGSTPRVSPIGDTALGSVSSSASVTWGEMSGRNVTSLSSARATFRHIPATMAATYADGDFARRSLDSYGHGAKRSGLIGVYGWLPGEFFAFITLYSKPSASSLPIAYAGSGVDRWLTIDFANQSFSRTIEQSFNGDYRPGSTGRLAAFRSPTGPGLDVGGLQTDGPRCLMCYRSGRLVGNLPAANSAGTTSGGEVYSRDMLEWSLSRAGRPLDRGFFGVYPRTEVDPGDDLTLAATFTPGLPGWRLGSSVSSRWGFTVPDTQGPVPLLRASYAVPTRLDGRIASDTVRFPLRFDTVGGSSPRVREVAVSFSTDGDTWTPATVTRFGPTAFAVKLPNPDAGPVSLRLDAEAASGSTLTEETTNAWEVAGGSSAGAAGASDDSGASAQSDGAVVAAAYTPAAGGATSGFDPNRLCRTDGSTRVSCFTHLQEYGRAARTPTGDPAGWGAPALRDAYAVGSSSRRTVVSVTVAGHYPTAEKDLNTYRRTYGLPPCTKASGCFTQINQDGETGDYPRVDAGWSVEAALDLQMISAACPSCRLVLAEGDQATTVSLAQATRSAIDRGATVTNHSYGAQEYRGMLDLAPAYTRPGVTAVVASGDSGFTSAAFPASVPQAVAVGGTVLTRSPNPRGFTERAWAGGGSGCSGYFAKPAYQRDPACPKRTIGDVSAVATDLAIYNTTVPKRYAGWLEVSGTSASSPFVAGLIGAAGGGGLRPGALYADRSDLRDLVTGSNGFCQGSYVCTAKKGYDAPTGLGTPRGYAAFGG